QANTSVSTITGTITSSMRMVDQTIRSRCCRATSPEGDITTMSHPASRARGNSTSGPRRDLDKDITGQHQYGPGGANPTRRRAGGALDILSYGPACPNRGCCSLVDVIVTH